MGWLIFWIICGIAGGAIGSSKGKKGKGIALGFLLGPIGLLICIFMRPDEAVLSRQALSSGIMKKCPHCAELIKRDARVCHYCGKDVY